MIWLGYVYLLILVIVGGTAVLDDLKPPRTGRFAANFLSFAMFVFVTVCFLFLPKPGALSWVVLASVAVAVLIVIWDAATTKKDPDVTPGGAIIGYALMLALNLPAIIFGVLWAQ